MIWFASWKNGNSTYAPGYVKRNPKKYYAESFDSFNVPDFTKTKVDFDIREARRQVLRDERIQVRIKD